MTTTHTQDTTEVTIDLRRHTNAGGTVGVPGRVIFRPAERRRVVNGSIVLDEPFSVTLTDGQGAVRLHPGRWHITECTGRLRAYRTVMVPDSSTPVAYSALPTA